MRALTGGLHEIAVLGPATLTEVWVRITWGGDSAAGVIPMASGSGSRIIPGIPERADVVATVYTDASLTQPACTST